MEFYTFLSKYSNVETVISLTAFVVAASLGFFLAYNNSRLKLIKGIIQTANTNTKAELAKQLLEVFPADKVPELTQKQGYQLLTLQLEAKSEEFKTRMKAIRLGIIGLVLIILVLAGKNLFSSESTSGQKSPIVHGANARINYTDKDTTDTSK
jgi:hypothetical protein